MVNFYAIFYHQTLESEKRHGNDAEFRVYADRVTRIYQTIVGLLLMAYPVSTFMRAGGS